MNFKAAFLSCEIKRGGFSGERFFIVSLPNGERYESLAPVDYFRTSDFAELDKESPSGEAPLSGYVVALPVKKERDYVVVEVPDGELIWVSEKALKSSREASQNVPVGS
jgi:hypothetical protein